MRIFELVLRAFRMSRLVTCSSTQQPSSVFSSLPHSHYQDSTKFLDSPSSSRSFSSQSWQSGQCKSIPNCNLERFFQRLHDKLTLRDAEDQSQYSVRSASDILPVALINHNFNNKPSLKILFIPINIFEGGDGVKEKTLSVLSIIQDNGSNIAAFTGNLRHFTYPKAIMENMSKDKDSKTSCTFNDIRNNLDTLNQIKEGKEMSLRSIAQQHDSYTISLHKDLIEALMDQNLGYIPNALWNKLGQGLYMQISPAMEDTFFQYIINSIPIDVNMLNASNSLNIAPVANSLEKSISEPKNMKSFEDSISSIISCLDTISRMNIKKTLVKFSAFDQSIVEADTFEKILDQQKPIQIQDSVGVTSASIFSAATQRGRTVFPVEIARKSFSTKSGTSTTSTKKRSPHIICVRQGDKGCTSPGLADNPMFGSDTADTRSISGSLSSAKFQKKSVICSDEAAKARGLMSCRAYAQAQEEAEKRRAALKSNKKGGAMATAECKSRSSDKVKEKPKPQPKIECVRAKHTEPSCEGGAASKKTASTKEEKKSTCAGAASKKNTSKTEERQSQKNFPRECFEKEKPFVCNKQLQAKSPPIQNTCDPSAKGGKSSDSTKPKIACKTNKSEQKASKPSVSCKSAQGKSEKTDSKQDDSKPVPKKGTCQTVLKANRSSDSGKTAMSKQEGCKTEQKRSKSSDPCEPAHSKKQRPKTEQIRSSSSDPCNRSKSSDPCQPAQGKKDSCISALRRSKSGDHSTSVTSRQDASKSNKNRSKSSDPCRTPKSRDASTSEQKRSKSSDPCGSAKSRDASTSEQKRSKSSDPCKSKSDQNKSKSSDPCKSLKSKQDDSKSDQKKNKSSDPCKSLKSKQDASKSDQNKSKSSDPCKSLKSKQDASKSDQTKSKSSDPCKSLKSKQDASKSDQSKSKSSDPCKSVKGKQDASKSDQAKSKSSNPCQPPQSKKDTSKSAQKRSKSSDPCKSPKSKDASKSGEKRSKSSEPCKSKSDQNKSKSSDPCKSLKSKQDASKSDQNKSKSSDPCKSLKSKPDASKSDQKKTKSSDPCKPAKSKQDASKSEQTKSKSNDPCKSAQGKKDGGKPTTKSSKSSISSKSSGSKMPPCKPKTKRSKSSDPTKTGQGKPVPCKPRQGKKECKPEQKRSKSSGPRKPPEMKICKTEKTFSDSCQKAKSKSSDACKKAPSESKSPDACKRPPSESKSSDTCKKAQTESKSSDTCKKASQGSSKAAQNKAETCQSQESSESCPSIKDASTSATKKSRSKTALRTKPKPTKTAEKVFPCPISTPAAKIVEEERKRKTVQTKKKSRSSSKAKKEKEDHLCGIKEADAKKGVDPPADGKKSADTKKAAGPCMESKAKDAKPSKPKDTKSSKPKSITDKCPGLKTTSTKPSCPGGKGKSGNKCFSTTSIVSSHDGIIKRNFSMSSFGMFRKFLRPKYFGFSKFERYFVNKDGKCIANLPKLPRKRFNITRKDTSKNTDGDPCYKNDADLCEKSHQCNPLLAKTKDKRCPKTKACSQERKACPAPMSKQCKDHKKENKNLYKAIFSKSTKVSHVTSTSLNGLMRSFCTYRGKENNCDNDENEKEIEELENEAIKIANACQIEIFSDVVPRFSDYDALVRTTSVAISGSDIHVYENGGKAMPEMTLGHDASGIVEKVGKCVTNLRPGDRVAIESGLSCGICNFCKRGAYNICPHLIHNGFFSKFQVHPADLCHKLPEHVSMENGALAQILATGCEACSNACIKPTSNVLVLGSSPTAIAAGLCVRAIGAKRICFMCSHEPNLELIRTQFNFDYLIHNTDMEFMTIIESVCCFLGQWPDVVINCAVNDWTLNISIMSLAPNGVCVMAECESECASFNVMEALMKNLKLIPSFRSANMFPTALLLMETGQACMNELIVKSYPWEKVHSAFMSALHHSNVSNKKVIVNVGDKDINFKNTC